MGVYIKAPRRGKSTTDLINAVADDRTLTCFDVGVFMRLKRALEADGAIDFYLDDSDPHITSAIERLAIAGFVTFD